MSDLHINFGDDRSENFQDLPDNKKKFKDRIKDFFANPKKRLIFIVSFGVLLLVLFGLGFYLLTNEDNKSILGNSTGKSKGNAKQEQAVPAVLDGVMTTSEAANRHPLAVIIENHPDSRPQAGLDKASIVYEAIVEGGITRFMAIFGTNEAEKVGPVRSARTFFVDWSRSYNAYLAHVGGNIDALDQIEAEKVLDLDQFAYSDPYWRERSVGIATEHTMYTGTPRLREQVQKNNYTTANNFNVFRFKDDPAGDEKDVLPASQKVAVKFSSDQYNVEFSYDKATNSYKRALAGSPHVDQISKNQINPKNLIVMTVNRKPVTTRINESGYEMTTVGAGKAKIFIDGKTIDGSWKKTSKTDRELFYDANGQEITFNRGQFWIAVIPPDASVTVE